MGDMQHAAAYNILREQCALFWTYFGASPSPETSWLYALRRGLQWLHAAHLNALCHVFACEAKYTLVYYP